MKNTVAHIKEQFIVLWAFLVKSVASYESPFSTLAGRFQPDMGTSSRYWSLR